MEQVIRFRIDQNTLTKVLPADDLEAIELAQEGEPVKSYRIKRMDARFMVDEAGQPIPYQKALREFGKLTVEEYGEFGGVEHFRHMFIKSWKQVLGIIQQRRGI